MSLESLELLAIVNCLALVVDQTDDGPFHAMIGVDRSAADDLRARLTRILKSLLPLAPEGAPTDRGGTSWPCRCAVLARSSSNIRHPESMAEVVFESDRSFQLWAYSVGHAQLLLRSVRDSEHATRIDVLFVGTRHVNVPTTLEGLRVERGGDRFRLSGKGWEGTIEALNVAYAEDEGEYYDASPFAESSGV